MVVQKIPRGGFTYGSHCASNRSSKALSQTQTEDRKAGFVVTAESSRLVNVASTSETICPPQPLQGPIRNMMIHEPEFDAAEPTDTSQPCNLWLPNSRRGIKECSNPKSPADVVSSSLALRSPFANSQICGLRRLSTRLPAGDCAMQGMMSNLCVMRVGATKQILPSALSFPQLPKPRLDGPCFMPGGWLLVQFAVEKGSSSYFQAAGPHANNLLLHGEAQFGPVPLAPRNHQQKLPTSSTSLEAKDKCEHLSW